METKELYARMGISNEVYEYGERIIEKLRTRFDEIDRVAEQTRGRHVEHTLFDGRHVGTQGGETFEMLVDRAHAEIAAAEAAAEAAKQG